ncbi:MAG: G5 domain-containing protein [Anaerolineae bacterium]|nr:G5 domain-containing protein [Anaerolineae bacterium]
MTPDTLFPPATRRSSLPFWLAVAAVVVVALTGGALVANHLTRITITLDVSGNVRQISTRAETVDALLDEADVLIDPEDVISPATTAQLEDGMTITVRKAFAVAVEADSDVRHVRTQHTHPLDILIEQQIHIGTYDVVQVDGQDYTLEQLQNPPHQSWTTPPHSIRVIRSVTLQIIDGDHTLTIHSTQADVARALDAAGLALYLADAVTPDLSAPVEDGLVVHIQRSQPVTLVADGRQISTRARGPTVGDALAAIGVAPVGQDYTIPPVDTPVEPEMEIQVIRVTEQVITEHETIPFTVIYRPSPDLPLDEQDVLQEGAEGLRERHIRVRYEDGLEVSRTVQDEWIAQPPAPRLIAYGTQIKLRSLDTPDGPVEYWRQLRMRATSYSPSRSGIAASSPGYGLTTTGAKLARGIVAVDPAIIPLSSAVYVPEYGHAIAGDTRDDIQNRSIALGYDDEGWQPWHGWVDVYLLAPAPSPDAIPYLLPSKP